MCVWGGEDVCFVGLPAPPQTLPGQPGESQIWPLRAKIKIHPRSSINLVLLGAMRGQSSGHSEVIKEQLVPGTGTGMGGWHRGLLALEGQAGQPGWGGIWLGGRPGALPSGGTLASAVAAVPRCAPPQMAC